MDDTFKKVIVDYIYTDSPAEESGIMVGDEIIQIDGVSTVDLQLPQIRSMLSQDGQEVDILVSREGEIYSPRLRLRALISPETAIDHLVESLTPAAPNRLRRRYGLRNLHVFVQ
jgi:S1-C subfamily serine protease